MRASTITGRGFFRRVFTLGTVVTDSSIGLITQGTTISSLALSTPGTENE